MKNLTSEELKEFSTPVLLKFLNDIYYSHQYYDDIVEKFLPFNVENLFSFNVYIPNDSNMSFLNVDKLQIILFEMVWYHKKSYSLKFLDPRLDNRFMNESWLNSLVDVSPTSKKIWVTPENLLNIIKFAVRLSKIKVFE